MRLCECGCGHPTRPARQTVAKLGVRKGDPQRFLRGHSGRGHARSSETVAKISVALRGKHTRERSSGWNGGKLTRYGRVFRLVGVDHPLADVNGYAAEHRLVFSEAIGRPLTRAEQVHHIDLNPANNDIANLVVLTRSTHRRLHCFLDRGLSHEEAMRETVGVGVRV